MEYLSLEWFEWDGLDSGNMGLTSIFAEMFVTSYLSIIEHRQNLGPKHQTKIIV